MPTGGLVSFIFIKCIYRMKLGSLLSIKFGKPRSLN